MHSLYHMGFSILKSNCIFTSGWLLGDVKALPMKVAVSTINLQVRHLQKR